MVSGGHSSTPGLGRQSTTEILVQDETTWKFVGELPIPISSLEAATLGNKVFVIGKTEYVMLHNLK